MSSKHARRSPSAGKRWSTCPGSVQLIESLDLPSSSNKYTAEGTVAHEIHELCLLENNNAKKYIGKIIKVDGFRIKVTEEMTETVQRSIDFIRDKIEHAKHCQINPILLVEEQVSLKHLKVPGLDGGTGDVIIIYLTGKKVNGIVVVDYKHGKGVEVSAENNFQMLCYGEGALEYCRKQGYNIKDNFDITLAVSQPRINNISQWDIDKKYLQNWVRDELVPKAKATLEDDAPLVPSEDGCRFCEAKTIPCPALMKKTTEVAQSEFEKFMLPDVQSLGVEQKLKVVKYKPLLEKFFKDVEKSVFKEMMNGSKEYDVEFKFVRKRANRKFTKLAFDEVCSPLYDHLKEDELYEKSPKGLGNIESTLKDKGLKPKEIKEIMDEITEKPEGELTIAPITDKRKAMAVKGIVEFNDLDEEEDGEDW